MGIYLPLLSTPNSFPLKIWCRRFFISKGLRFIKLSEASSPKNKHRVSVPTQAWWQGKVEWRGRGVVVETKGTVGGLPAQDHLSTASGLKGTDPW